MNLRKFERELEKRQDQFHIAFSRIKQVRNVMRTLVITVEYIGPAPNRFVQQFKFLQRRFSRKHLKVLMKQASDLSVSLRPHPQMIQIHVR